ncbi:hypothetical protein EYF80_033651 [Liparis tanakae]|uniref:Uncharacterized protein n=1 Tax=Liparis tanakae TaxID=230148 RepID=A0A4Z2GS24_9TELE|nr:hypothetical protein EYF80_033651 [Liparis tanakae]
MSCQCCEGPWPGTTTRSWLLEAGMVKYSLGLPVETEVIFVPERISVRRRGLLATLGLERWSARFLRSRSSPLIFFGSGYESQPACGLSGEPFCTELLYNSKPSLFGRSFPFLSRPRSDAEEMEGERELMVDRFRRTTSVLHGAAVRFHCSGKHTVVEGTREEKHPFSVILDRRPEDFLHDSRVTFHQTKTSTQPDYPSPSFSSTKRRQRHQAYNYLTRSAPSARNNEAGFTKFLRVTLRREKSSESSGPFKACCTLQKTLKSPLLQTEPQLPALIQNGESGRQTRHQRQFGGIS